QVDGFKVTALVDEHYLARVAAGQRASAEIGGAPQAMQVVKVYPEVKERQFRIDIAFADATPSTVRRGQSLQLKIEIGAAADGLVVGNGPFYDDTGGQWAFVVRDSRIATKHPVKFGRRNPDSVEVLEGLREGDRVITSSYATLQRFDRIEILE
ncbi:MAG TPA: hypothetical protein PKE27_14680, partial [Povalibacter sp.]|uniref:efflux RND transporter periplasmic adaptor subunit n=1 Tax=Povalibacter sp. TaxID=1962978 RepID=UPI002C888AF0